MKRRRFKMLTLLKECCVSSEIHTNRLAPIQPIAHNEIDPQNETLALQLDVSTTMEEANKNSRNCIRSTKSKLQKFVNKHKSCIGLHAFIAGLVEFLSQQIGNSEVLVWSFDGSVLTENNSDDDAFAFTQEAIWLLLSFMNCVAVTNVCADNSSIFDECKKESSDNLTMEEIAGTEIQLSWEIE